MVCRITHCKRRSMKFKDTCFWHQRNCTNLLPIYKKQKLFLAFTLKRLIIYV